MTSNPIPGIAGFSANAPRHFWTTGSRGMFGVKLGLRRSESPQVSRLGGGYKAFVGLMGCFKDPLMKGQKGGFVDVWDAAAFNWPEKFPEHLIIMVNGIVGSAKDWRYAAQQFVKKLPDNVIVHCSKCNSSLLTFDGVDLMGERLAGEVLSIVNHRPGVRKISFVAHSLGGLVARYAIGRLYNAIPRDHFGADKHLKGTVAGLEPMNFITVATPHLGSRGHKQLPFLCGLPFLEQRASEIAHLIVGRTGKHLFLTDNEDGSHPLLLQMTHDCDDLKFMSALCSFGRRAAYANTNFDLMVGWRTSSIRRQYELPQSHLLIREDKYPHIVYVERGKAENIHKESSDVNGQKVDLEEEMIRGLRQVSWERVDVSFQKSTQRYIAHSTIQVKSYWMNSDGADIILHMIDNFIV